MALSGSFETTAYSNRNLVFNWNATQSVSGNYSIINWSLVGGGSASGYYKAAPFTVVIDGEQVHYSDARIQLRNGTIVATGSKVIYHDSDGSRGFSASVSAAIYSYAVNVSGSDSWNLDSIPRAAIITSAQDFTDKDNPTITYSNPAGTAVTSLQACIANPTGDVIYVPYRNINKTGTLSYTFHLTESEKETLLRATIGNPPQLNVKFCVATVISGTTLYDTHQKIFTVSDDIKPNAAVTLSDTEGYLEKYGKHVQCKSKLHVVINAEGIYGSTIKSCKTTFDGRTFTEAEFTTDAITGKDTLELEVVVTDSRGRSCTVKESIEVYEYNRPKITSIKAKRCQQHNVNLIGDEYLGVLFSAAVTPLDNQNAASYELDYKKTTDENYTTLSLEDYANQYAVDGNTIFAADDDAYNIILRITDDFGTIEKKINGPSVSVLVSKLKYNLGLAFGKLAELAGVLDIGFKTRFFGGILQVVLEDGSDFDELTTSNIFTLKESSAAGYLNCPIAEGTGTLTVEECGENKIHQIVKSCDKINPKVYERFYDEEWGEWIWINAPYGFITGYMPTAVTVNGYGTIPFVEENKSGPYFTLQDGVITIGKDVACVRVSAVIGGSAVSGRCWAHLGHIDASQTNGAFTSIADAIQYGAFVSPHLTKIIPVNEGDTLRVYVIEEFTARSGGVDCYISVERMK